MVRAALFTALATPAMAFSCEETLSLFEAVCVPVADETGSPRRPMTNSHADFVPTAATLTGRAWRHAEADIFLEAWSFRGVDYCQFTIPNDVCPPEAAQARLAAIVTEQTLSAQKRYSETGRLPPEGSKAGPALRFQNASGGDRAVLLYYEGTAEGE
ncbi:MAG: hypothetical protein AAFR35_01330 [Pseudomonadota bacterium]